MISTTADPIDALGWALVHSLWQVAALALVAAVSFALLRRPATRYLAGVGVLAAMLALPVATFVGGLDAGAVPAAQPERDPVTAAGSLPAATTSAAERAAAPVHSLVSPRALTAAVLAWCGGVLVLGLRALGAFWWVRRLRRASSDLPRRARELCREVERRLGVERAVLYRASATGEGPAVVGILRPMVLLPLAALSGLPPEQLRLIVAHELAHIRRWDALVNLGQVLVETLLFYHPGVWWLSRRIRSERELACDDLVLGGGGRQRALDYARALSSLAALPRSPVLALGARGGSVTRRVERILGVHRTGSGARGLRLAAAVAGLLVALVALSGLAAAQNRSPMVTTAAAVGMTVDAVAATAPPLRASAGPAPATARPATNGAARHTRAREPRAAREAEPQRGGSFIDGIRAAGLDPDVDQLIALKVHGVTPRYVRDLAAAGYTLDVDDVIAMRVHGVTPELAAQVRAQGFTASKDDLMALKVHGVDPAVAGELRAAGFEPALDDLIALRIHDMSPELAAGLKRTGLVADIDDAVAAAVHGITPEFVELAQRHGFDDLDLDQLVQLRRLGVLDDSQ